MKASMESTSKTIILNGMNFRVWEGVTAKGIPFVALVNRCEPADPGVSAAFVQELTGGTQATPKDTTQPALERLGVVPAPPPTSTAV